MVWVVCFSSAPLCCAVHEGLAWPVFQPSESSKALGGTQVLVECEKPVIIWVALGLKLGLGSLGAVKENISEVKVPGRKSQRKVAVDGKVLDGGITGL